MEDPSVDSSMNTKAVVGSRGMSTTRTTTTIVTSPAEESGWTSYFENFSNQNHSQEHSFCSSFGSSSMVSDAASFPPRKSSHDHHHVVSSSSIRDTPKKLTFKKTRTKEISLDDSLEDTASSPVNSPKVSDNLRPVDMNSRRPNFDHNSSLGNNHRGISLDQYAGEGMETEAERCEMNYNGKNINDCTDLKKRGLCLVPLSMLVNYLG